MTSSPLTPPFKPGRDGPPDDVSPARQALWWDANGDWTRAHDLIADENGTAAARVHAYLHRKEGDLGNARYWYNRAAQQPFPGSLEDEYHVLTAEID